ncbi:NAD(P)-dependent oxidoreductase [Streptomyces sp. NPDC006602]|uniref:NAD(P)-dependent oxidoreductase n=1 Tax=Streptomyces sp. NPDC006602 TaxID=3364751 RepID=UPI0036AB2B5B
MSRVAVLGLGAMGFPLARRLAETGHTVRAWNRTPGRAGLAECGITAAATPGEAVAQAEYVITVLADDAALTATLEGGLLDALGAGQLVLNFGTVASATIQELALRVAERGAELLDVGMLGNAVHAGRGELRLYVGGAQDQLERVRPLLRDLAKEVTHIGPLGSGMDLKLVLNLLMGLEMQALGEVVALGEALGLDRSVVLDSVTVSGFSAPVMGFKARRMASGRYGAPDFRLALMTKDLRLAEQAAHTRDTALPMTAAAHSAHHDAVSRGWGDLDCASIAHALPGGTPDPSHRAAGGRPGPPGNRPGATGDAAGGAR